MSETWSETCFKQVFDRIDVMEFGLYVVNVTVNRPMFAAFHTAHVDEFFSEEGYPYF